MKRMWLFASLISSCFGSYSASADYYQFVGQVETFGFNFCPAGWLPLDGQLLSTTNYNVLFNLLGTMYGGDGSTTFALPLGKPVLTLKPGTQLIQCIAYLGIYPSQN